jgi:hypothetical protein
VHPPVGLDNFQWVGGRRENLGDERVGIERDRRDEIFELLGASAGASEATPGRGGGEACIAWAGQPGASMSTAPRSAHVRRAAARRMFLTGVGLRTSRAMVPILPNFGESEPD